MNLKRRVWIPPDGDSRLIRFQEELAWSLGETAWSALPPHLELNTRMPRGPVCLLDWVEPGDPTRIWAQDDQGILGTVHLCIPTTGARDPLRQKILTPVPRWRWTRGRLADLVIETPDGDDHFILWSWANVSGWRSDLSKEPAGWDVPVSPTQ